jgi:nucleoside-diphosphate-sugar epimerase
MDKGSYITMQGKTLIIGASGQIGIELTLALRAKYGNDAIIASDIRKPNDPIFDEGPFEVLNVLDKPSLEAVIEKHNISYVYQLAALLSATSEKNPEKAWDLNMNGLFHILDIAKAGKIQRVFWPSSIAAFGPNTPADNTPQYTIMEPTSVYGISKLTGERWCEYYFNKYGVDVRSLRYPGLIGWKSAPGGGTTDYAVHIFHEALEKGSYTSFLSETTRLPMMYMPDAIEATVKLMLAPAEQIKVRSSYNLAGFSFTPKELANEIRNFIPEFSIDYAPDFRQAIADSWPASIDDSAARNDWGWNPAFDLSSMTRDMLQNLSIQKKITV